MNRNGILRRVANILRWKFDLSLRHAEWLLAALDRPEKSLPPVVHVTGANGKGATIALMRIMLEAVSQRVDHRQDAIQKQVFKEPAASIALVAKQAFRAKRRRGRLNTGRDIVRDLATRQDEAGRASLMVRAGVDLAPPKAAV